MRECCSNSSNGLRLEDIREGLFTVLREHCCNHVDDNLKFCIVSCSNIYEDVSCVERDFTVFGVDDGREGEDAILLVINDRVDR